MSYTNNYTTANKFLNSIFNIILINEYFLTNNSNTFSNKLHNVWQKSQMKFSSSHHRNLYVTCC